MEHHNENTDRRPTLRFCALGGLLLIIVSLLLFHPTTQNAFLWDSNHYLTTYEFWLSSLRLEHLTWMLLALELANWHPLTWFSWALDYRIYGGLDAPGFHFTNNLLHALNSALVFLLALKVYRVAIRNARMSYSRIAVLLAAFSAGLLFAVHPQHVQSVAWVAERKDVLCQFFLLGAMICHLHYATSAGATRRRWYRIALLSAALATMAKPMAVSLPVVLLLLDIYPLRRIGAAGAPEPLAQVLREKLPFFALAVLLIALTLVAQQASITGIPLHLRILNAFSSVFFYLQKWLWPSDLSPYYPYAVNAGEAIGWTQLAPILAFVVLTTATIAAWRHGRLVWLVAWTFYLVTITPVIGVIQVGIQGAADRYAYFPTLPLYLLVGAGVLLATRHLAGWRQALPLSLVLVAALALGQQTRAQIRIWHDSQSLWGEAVRLYPNAHFPNLQMGVALLNAHRFDEASRHFDFAGEQQTVQTELLAWRALAYMELQRNQEALSLFFELGLKSERRPSLVVDAACIQYNIGWNMVRLGLWQDARDMFDRARGSPDRAIAARKWLEWLDQQALPESGTALPPSTFTGLPGYCPKPLLSMRGVVD